MTRTFGGSGAGQSEASKRGILDSKVWEGLKMLDTDKVGFKEWTVKLRNKYLQVRTGTSTRDAWGKLDSLAIWSSTLTEGPMDEDI